MTAPIEIPRRSITRAVVAVVIGTIVAPLALIVSLKAGLGLTPAIATTTAAALLVIVLAWPFLPTQLAHDNASHRWMFAIWLALSLVASYRIASLSVFMYDVERVEYRIAMGPRMPADAQVPPDFFERHYCYTAYAVAASLASQHVENIYDLAHYDEDPALSAVHEAIGDAHTIDAYQYPPQFLLLPRVLTSDGQGFFRARTIWYAVCVITIGTTFLVVGLWVGGRSFGPYWLAWPAVMLAPVTMVSLQIGNAHLFIVCISILAMICFETRWGGAIGGLLLGFAVVGKLFPGVLLAYLFFRRRWGAVAWTVLAMVAYTGATYALFGRGVFDAFIKYHLPQIASGEAFAFAREYAMPLTSNMSVMGLAYKLARLELLGGLDPHVTAQIITWAFTFVALGVLVALGIQHRRFDRAAGAVSPSRTARQALAVSWLVILILGQLRSPFLPWIYGNMIIVWLLALLLHDERRWLDRAILMALAWCVFAIGVPLPFGPDTIRYDMAFTLIAFTLLFVLTIGLFVWELQRTRAVIRAAADGASRDANALGRRMTLPDAT